MQAEAERREITEERFTSLDRRLLRDAQEINSDLGPAHFAVTRNPLQAGSTEMARLRAGHEVARLAVLCRMGLAESMGPNRWRVRRDFDQILPGNAENQRQAKDARRTRRAGVRRAPAYGSTRSETDHVR